MNTTRRGFLQQAGMGAMALPVLAAGSRVVQAEAAEPSSFLTGKPSMKLGTVTYNLAKDWDIETLIRNCEATGFQGVELRTTHAHKVEISLSKAERSTVKKRFADSKVELMGLGSAFDYHTPDAAKLKADIAATQEYMVLAHDVGASGVKVRPNGFPKGVDPRRTLEQIGNSLRILAEFGKNFGVVIRLEVHGEGTSLLPNIQTILEVADHPGVGVTWNSNQTDLAGEGFDANFDRVKDRIFCVHMRDLYLDEYPFRRLLTRLNEIKFQGYCLAEIPDSKDPLRVMRYYRSLWLAYQGLL